MYGADGRSITASEKDRMSTRSPYPPSSSGRNHPNAEGGGPALEVLELSNGQVVWKVVDGLRSGDDFDYDGDSAYRSRQSFASEYSVREPKDEMQLFVREHKRLSSKGSGNSSAFNRKTGHGGASRPETKVFFSDPEHIGKLIDSITRGLQSGSFNIVPNAGGASHPQSSATSVQHEDWTVEEHLEHMLGSLNPA